MCSLRFIDPAFRNRAPHGTWQSLRDELDDDGVLFELVVAIGNWQLCSNLLRTLKVPLEDGVQPWPPDGRRPATFPG